MRRMRREGGEGEREHVGEHVSLVPEVRGREDKWPVLLLMVMGYDGGCHDNGSPSGEIWRKG